MASIPKAVLYYAEVSVWSSVVLLALEEKGYGKDEVDRKLVDLGKGENYSPSFLRLNPKATVPTLVVPLQKTLSEDVESRYKPITDSKDIVEFLDKSRSASSRTHTTSHAPAPALAPATIAFASISRTVVNDILHSEDAVPSNFRYMNARNEAELQAISEDILPVLAGRHEALLQHISAAENDQIQVSEKVKNLWHGKKAAVEVLLEVFSHADRVQNELDTKAKEGRQNYFRTARTIWEVTLPNILTKLSKTMIGPYVLGDQLSIADLHLTAWLARLVKLTGGSISTDGNTAIAKIEERIGTGFSLPKDFKAPANQQQETNEGSVIAQSKLAAFWDVVRERPSMQKVYSQGLH